MTDTGATKLEARAAQVLADVFGAGATFRNGQWDAVRAVVHEHRRVLVVQRTGWGKSLVYFSSTRLLRDTGAGPTILISPLLSLMRNQEDMAARMRVRARRLDSTNTDDWEPIEEELRRDEVDLLMVSPERLSNEHFQTVTLPAIAKGIGLFVVDEAHCISDWGHDFRPDYRRIVRVLRALPSTVPVLATTATANQRVVDDICSQFGADIEVIRGSLARDTLRLQNIRLSNQAERLAWLARQLPDLPGSGIVYCSTTHDCDRVSAWLRSRGIDAPAYHGALPPEERPGLEQRLLDNEVKALVATVALGMGFDKPDLGFVVHYQRPGSVVDYYQRIGRAGRAVSDARVILLNGAEDDAIQEYFIRSAFPEADAMRAVLAAIDEADEGLSTVQLQAKVNIKASRIEKILKLLDVDGAIYRQDRRYYASGIDWAPDEARIVRITEARRQELARMQAFVTTRGCLMEFLTSDLDDPTSAPCGRCASCAGPFVPADVDLSLVREARRFLQQSDLPIEPRKRDGFNKGIPKAELAQPGRALSVYGDAGWGQVVADGKYQHNTFSDDLVQAAVELIRRHWLPDPPPQWVTAVPSLRRPTLVPDFARRLAEALGLPFVSALVKQHETPQQKTMENSAYQAANVRGAFVVGDGGVPSGAVLLVDDMVDSRWTLTECARVLRAAGSGVVWPFVLARSTGAEE